MVIDIQRTMRFRLPSVRESGPVGKRARARACHGTDTSATNSTLCGKSYFLCRRYCYVVTRGPLVSAARILGILSAVYHAVINDSTMKCARCYETTICFINPVICNSRLEEAITDLPKICLTLYALKRSNAILAQLETITGEE